MAASMSRDAGEPVYGLLMMHAEENRTDCVNRPVKEW